MQTVGVIGRGRFGAAFADLCRHRGHQVWTYDPADNPTRVAHACPHLRNVAERACTLVLAGPVASFVPTLETIRPLLHAKHVVLDVASVKLAAFDAFTRVLGPDIPWTLTHPLFGPVSLAAGEPLRAVVCPTQHPASAHEEIAAWLTELGIQTTFMSATAHDEDMARTHAIAFFVAQGLIEAHLTEPSALAPPSFQAMMRTVQAVQGDAAHLFATIEQDNPFAERARAQLLHAMQALHGRLASAHKA